MCGRMVEPQEVTRELVMPDGVTIHYRLTRARPRARTVVVLLHGLSSNLTRWSEFLEHTTLKRDHDILRLDLRGHGRSLTRRAIGMRVWCEDLARLLDAEGYARAVFIGHSLGAQVAVNFAHRYPQRVVGLALIDPVFAEALRGTMLWLSRLRWLVQAAVAVIRLANRLGIHRRRIPQRDLRELDERTRSALAAAGRPEDIVSHYTSPLVDIKHFPTAHYLQELIETTRPLPVLATINVPMLFVLSKGETFGDPAVARVAIARVPHAQTVIIDCYHWPLTEKPDDVRHALEDWCARLSSVD
jgi:pimeloyl-ACP methyl ester carboxylesterase